MLETVPGVADIMTQDVVCATPLTNTATAAEMMWTRNCGLLPVVDDRRRIIGVVTDRDLFIALGTRNTRPAELTLGEIMRSEPTVCSLSDDIRDALELMALQRVHRLPVVDSDGHVMGVLSLSDIAVRTKGTLDCGLILETMISICEDHRPAWEVHSLLQTQAA